MRERVVAVNKSASFEYFIEERFEAGIVLEGGEVKSVRLNNVNLKDSFCLISNREVFVKNMHIAVYDKSGKFNTKDSKRDRKLLLNKREIVKIIGKISQKGYTLVPLKMYFKEALIKLEIGLCKGKHTFDKKKCLMQKDVLRKAEREIEQYR